MAWQAAAAASAGNLLGGLAANRQNKKIAREQMAFQERMANTAHQRQVKDMRAAGLNPMLSAMGGSGAASPQGAGATMQNVMEGATSTALQFRQMKKDIQLAEQKIDLDKAAENLAFENSKVAQANATKIAKETKILDREEQVMQAEADFRKEKAQVDKDTYKAEKYIRMLGGAVSGIAGGLTGGLVGGAMKGLKKGKSLNKGSTDFRLNPEAQKRLIKPKKFKKRRDLY